MTIEKIIDYVMHTPYNTNRALLTQMLEELISQHTGGEGGGEGEGSNQIIYDGGQEN